MTYNEYLNACLKFAKDTKAWSWLDESRWFTTNGGINVAWAYKMSPDEVRKYAPQKFMDCCVDFLNLALDDPSAANDFVQMAYDLFS